MINPKMIEMVSIEIYCLNCGRKFRRFRRAKRNGGGRYGAIRLSTAVTCSKKCSRDLIKLRDYGSSKLPRRSR